MDGTVKPTRRYLSRLREEQAAQTRRRILDAARRILVDRGYGQVTMQAVAEEAGVAYQTVYALFGSKVRLALEVCDADLGHVGGALAVATAARTADDPEGLLRTVATVARRLYEPCADLLRFMRESGDADLVSRFRQMERSRLELLTSLGAQLDRTAGKRAKVSGPDVVDLVWVMAGPETYEQLVLDRGWAPDRFERWLGSALVDLVLRAGAG